MTWNLLGPIPGTRWRRRTAEAAERIRQLKPDLVATQEITARTLPILEDRLAGYAHRGRGQYAHGGGAHPRLWFRADRFEVLESGHFWLSHTPRVPGSRFPMTTSPRMATWAVLRDRREEHRFTWATTHLGHTARRLQAGVLREELEALPGPLILAGDFNSLPHPPWSAHRLLATGGFLADAWERAEERIPRSGGTLHLFTGLPLARLDWILVSPRARVPRCRVVRAPEVSDHFPVVAEVELGS